MRVILSRKGFDSGYGGVPSPILPDGRMVSLPIPSKGDLQRLAKLRMDGMDIGALVADLTRGSVGPLTTVHVDPDLQGQMLARLPGWRPAFGQIASAQSHLQNQGVGLGDIFLFFGWFRRVEQVDGRWRYQRGSPDIHALFGWLQIGEVLSVSGHEQEIVGAYPWLREHPHLAGADRFRSRNNTVYVASRFLCMAGQDTRYPGGGVFGRFTPSLQLTAAECTRSCWRLPAWFMPVDGRSPLSYHGKPSRWMADRADVLLRTVAKGQEFVLDCACYPEANAWLARLFDDAHRSVFRVSAPGCRSTSSVRSAVTLLVTKRDSAE
ncbi:Nmad3 family putative nucleotide modification protein [Cupriavidus necator]